MTRRAKFSLAPKVNLSLVSALASDLSRDYIEDIEAGALGGR